MPGINHTKKVGQGPPLRWKPSTIKHVAQVKQSKIQNPNTQSTVKSGPPLRWKPKNKEHTNVTSHTSHTSNTQVRPQIKQNIYGFVGVPPQPRVSPNLPLGTTVKKKTPTELSLFLGSRGNGTDTNFQKTLESLFGQGTGVNLGKKPGTGLVKPIQYSKGSNTKQLTFTQVLAKQLEEHIEYSQIKAELENLTNTGNKYNQTYIKDIEILKNKLQNLKKILTTELQISRQNDKIKKLENKLTQMKNNKRNTNETKRNAELQKLEMEIKNAQDDLNLIINPENSIILSKRRNIFSKIVPAQPTQPEQPFNTGTNNIKTGRQKVPPPRPPRELHQTVLPNNKNFGVSRRKAPPPPQKKTPNQTKP